MHLGLEDRIVLVSGSSRGIGRAIAEAFLVEGARTVVTGRDATSLAQSAADLRARFGEDRVLSLSADMTTGAGVDATLTAVRRSWGDVQVVVANIGTGRGHAGWDADESEWTRLFETNLFGAARLVTAALPSMLAMGQGSVVFVGSIAGREATPAPLPYSAAKAALASYAKNLARQLGSAGIRVNSVAPGNVLFPGGSWESRRKANPEQVDRYISDEVPLRRFGRAEEVAAVVVFLASDRASFVTGSCVVVDGGQTRGV